MACILLQVTRVHHTAFYKNPQILNLFSSNFISVVLLCKIWNSVYKLPLIISLRKNSETQCQFCLVKTVFSLTTLKHKLLLKINYFKQIYVEFEVHWLHNQIERFSQIFVPDHIDFFCIFLLT